jgi:hypothetical protein
MLKGEDMCESEGVLEAQRSRIVRVFEEFLQSTLLLHIAAVGEGVRSPGWFETRLLTPSPQ